MQTQEESLVDEKQYFNSQNGLHASVKGDNQNNFPL